MVHKITTRPNLTCSRSRCNKLRKVCRIVQFPQQFWEATFFYFKIACVFFFYKIKLQFQNEQDGIEHPIAGALLDQEFNFFLYLTKPMISLIPNIRDKAICGIWILTLAKVRTCSCLTMKAIRNDYMQALMG